MKTSELTDAALDWSVTKCQFIAGTANSLISREVKPYSTNWAHGGPIIEREKITLEWTGENWCAYIRHDEEEFGIKPLIAAMRCYVASKLGDEIELPEELTEAAHDQSN